VRVSDPLVKSLLLKRGNALLLVLCSWNREPNPAVVLTLNADGLGVKPTRAYDPEVREVPTPKPGEATPAQPVEPAKADVVLNAATGEVTVPLAGYGVRLVRLE
jgi:hypothetical protein